MVVDIIRATRQLPQLFLSSSGQPDKSIAICALALQCHMQGACYPPKSPDMKGVGDD